MVSTAPDDVAVLSSFVQSPSTASPEEAASTVRRVVAAAASPPGVSKTTVQLAQQVLQHLFKSPSSVTLPHLLPICEQDIPLNVIDVFILCTVAWKAVIAAALKSVREGNLQAQTGLRLIQYSSRAASSVLLRAVLLARSPSCTPPELARIIKIAKFFCLNAMRCTKAFVSAMHINASLSSQFSDALGAVLRLVSLITCLSCTEQATLASVQKDLVNDIAPPISTTFRSILKMIKPISSESELALCSSLVNKSLQSFSDPSAFQIDGTIPVDPSLMRIFAVLHLMRCASSKTLKGDDDLSFLRILFHSVFCRALFEGLDNSYEQLLTRRESNSGVAFAQVVADTAGQCMAVVDVERLSKSATTGAVQEALLIEMSAKNPIRAAVAIEGLVHIFKALTTHEERRARLFTVVITCGRTAHALESGHLESRWVPLASRLGENCLDDGNLLNSLFSTTRAGPSPPSLNEMTLMTDPFAMRIMAAICRNISVQNSDEKVTEDTAHFNKSFETGRVLQAFKIEQCILQDFVRKMVEQDCVNCDVLHSAVQLVPYIFDEKSASVLLVSLLGKKSLPSEIFCTVMNLLQFSSIQSSEQRRVLQAALAAIQQYGIDVCVPVTALVARAVHTMRKEASTDIESKLMDLLKLTVQTALRDSSTINNIRTTAMCGGTMFHTAQILSSVGSTNGNTVGSGLRLPDSVLPVAEEALTRLQMFQSRARNIDGVLELENESGVIKMEKEVCKRGANDRSQCSLLQERSSVADALRVAREAVTEALTGLARTDQKGRDEAEEMAETEALQCVLRCATQLSVRKTGQ